MLDFGRNKNILLKLRLEADLYAAVFCLRGHSNVLTIDEAGTKLQSTFQNSEDFEIINSKTKYKICLFTIENKINTITKEEASILLESLTHHLTLGIKSKFLILKMNFFKTIISLTDDEMMVLAKSFLEEKSIKLRC